jgi:hypothetical protein
MKSLILIPAFLLLGYGHTCLAQQKDDDTTVTEKRPLKPVPASSPTPQLPPANDYQSTDPLIRIRLDAIPPKMKKNLESSDNYNGWQGSPVYRNRDTRGYSIDIRSGDSLKTYRFNEAGEPSEVTGQNRKK